MKKLKLLSSLSALLLVLSVGACDKSTEDSSSDEVTSSESDSSTSSSESTPAPVELSNYTISITLKDVEGNTVAIPFYDSVYIIGDWDNWTEFIALTDAGDESGSVLTTTLDTIKEGSHEFKGLIGNQDDTPSWSLTELILAEDGKGNATFEVAASEGDNATKNLEFTVDATKIPVLDETPMDDETIMGLMLSAAEADSDEPWEAFHGYTTEEDETTVEVWFTQDEEEALYGKSIWYDEEDGDTTKFIVGGTAYVVDGEGEYDTQNYANDYEDEFDNYGAALSEFAYADVDDLGENATLTHEEGSSFYTLTWADTYTEVLVCQRAGDEFSVTRVEEYDEAGEGAIAEKISGAAVEAQMSGFNKWNWDIAAENPSELVEKAALTCNFSVEFEWIEYESANPMSYSDYNRLLTLDTDLYYYIDPDTGESLVDEDGNWVEGGEERYAALYIEYVELYAKYENIYEEFTIDQYYLSEAYYAEDYMVYDCYTLGEEDELVLYYELIYVIDDDGYLWEYFTLDEQEWQVDSVYGYHWSDMTYSLLDEYYSYDSASHLAYQDSGTTADGSSYDVYDFDDWSFSWSSFSYVSQASAYWFTCLGGWDMFGTNAYTYGLSTFTHYYTYFFPQEQIMQSIYTYGGAYYSDRNYDENTTVFYAGDEVYITVYDVNSTDASEAVNNAIQANTNA